jgi:hypothetical protein
MSMRKVLGSHQQVCHYWANKVQGEGKSGNMFFENARLYSYGHHFMIARHLSPGVVLFSLQDYSSSTSKHKSLARSAARHLTMVWAHDADATTAANKESTTAAINAELNNASTTRRILQRTRDAHRAEALRLAEQFNTYLAALPVDERLGVQPFDLTGESWQGLADALALATREKAEAEAAAKARRIAELTEHAARWRAGENVQASFHQIPPMLRLVRGKGLHTGGLIREGKTDVIETSHGAEIPARLAPLLWAVVQRARVNGAEPDVSRLPIQQIGHYRLSAVRADGSIVVGCHDIAYSELERMADALGLSVSAVAA